jgi:acyl-ACP thioesterase
VTVLADVATHRVKRVHSGLEAFGPNAVKPAEEEDLIPRMELPKELTPLGERRIFYSDLDANGHTNNAVYCDVVWDFLPPALRGTAGKIRISYRSETPEGDTLRVSGAESGGKYFLKGDNSVGMSFSACVSPNPAENP